MKITWDTEAQALYIKITDEPIRGQRELVDDMVITDEDFEGDLVGIEILGVDEIKVRGS